MTYLLFNLHSPHTICDSLNTLLLQCLCPYSFFPPIIPFTFVSILYYPNHFLFLILVFHPHLKIFFHLMRETDIGCLCMPPTRTRDGACNWGRCLWESNPQCISPLAGVVTIEQNRLGHTHSLKVSSNHLPPLCLYCILLLPLLCNLVGGHDIIYPWYNLSFIIHSTNIIKYILCTSPCVELWNTTTSK